MMHPLNAALRFGLELLSLGMFARFGLSISSGPVRYVWMLVLPLVAAALWGTFTVPGDPSRGKDGLVPVSGATRLALEATFFGAAAASCYALTTALWTGLFIGAVVLHYAWAHRRNRWLLTQRT